VSTPRDFSLKKKIALTSFKALAWARSSVPFGVRSLLGIGLMVGGIFGFLPILGFWMFPLGLAFIALDIPFTRAYIEKFMCKLESVGQENGDTY
jgi:hypothetical protein